MAAITGLEKLEFAPISADGKMPTAGWVAMVGIEEDSLSITSPTTEMVNVYIEEIDDAWDSLKGRREPMTITGNYLNMSVDNANLLFKGEFTTGESKFTPSIGGDTARLAIRMTTKAHNGVQAVFSIPTAVVSAGFANNVSKNNFLAFNFTATVVTPKDATGKSLAPWDYEVVEVIPAG